MKKRNSAIVCSLVILALHMGAIIAARADHSELPAPDPPPVSTAAPVMVEVTPTPAPTPEPTPESTPEPELVVDEHDAQLIARTIWGEARGCSTVEQAAVAWCILNRVDVDAFAMGRSVEYVVTFPEQFHGYSASNPLDPALYALAVDVLTRWEREKLGETDVGRVLPPEFLWFSGDGEHNHFRDTYTGNFNTWDWSLPDPYIEGD